MKTKEELNAIKNEVETVSRKLAQLNEEELSQVSGGMSERELLELAMKQQIDITRKQKEELIKDMEEIIQESHEL